MPHESDALKQIRQARLTLENARNSLSEALLNCGRKGLTEKDTEYQQLMDLHHRVTQALSLLPQGGDNRVKLGKLTSAGD